MISTSMIVLLVAVLVALGGCSSWCTRRAQQHNNIQNIPGVCAFQDFLKTIIPVEAYCPCGDFLQRWTSLCCWQDWCEQTRKEIIFKVVFYLVCSIIYHYGHVHAAGPNSRLFVHYPSVFCAILPTDSFLTILLGGVLGYKYANMMERHGRDSVSTMLGRVPGAQLFFGRVRTTSIKVPQGPLEPGVVLHNVVF